MSRLATASLNRRRCLSVSRLSATAQLDRCTAATRFVSLNRDRAPTVADTSPVGNFSRRHEAYCFHQLGHALPSLVDYALSCDRGRRASLAGVISDVVAFDDNRSTAGAQPIADVLVEPIDVPSLRKR